MALPARALNSSSQPPDCKTKCRGSRCLARPAAMLGALAPSATDAAGLLADEARLEAHIHATGTHAADSDGVAVKQLASLHRIGALLLTGRHAPSKASSRTPCGRCARRRRRSP